MRLPIRSTFFSMTLAGVALSAAFGFFRQSPVDAAGPVEPARSSFRVLTPVESGNLLLFPVVQTGKLPPAPFLTLDEGIKSGEVEITEAGRVRGLVRPRPPAGPQDGV